MTTLPRAAFIRHLHAWAGRKIGRLATTEPSTLNTRHRGGVVFCQSKSDKHKRFWEKFVTLAGGGLFLALAISWIDCQRLIFLFVFRSIQRSHLLLVHCLVPKKITAPARRKITNFESGFWSLGTPIPLYQLRIWYQMLVVAHRFCTSTAATFSLTVKFFFQSWLWFDFLK